MCGRFSVVEQIRALAKRFKFGLPKFSYNPRFNLAPSQMALTVIEKDKRMVKLMHWGLIPSWAKDKKISYKMINARAETISEKPSYRRPFQTKRCLVLADGYYEWQVVPKEKYKKPHRIKLQNGEPFAMAGIYDIWKPPKGDEVFSFSIITTSASKKIEHIHDRMPVILEEKDEDFWLNPNNQDINQLKKLLKPYNSKQLDSYEVSKIVNSPTNDVEACLEPVQS